MDIIAYQILTIGGVALWEECNSLHIIKDILQPNGIHVMCKPIRHKQWMLCEVDSTKTVMDDFYKWEDNVDPEMFCWRTFYKIEGKDGHSWLPIPIHETLGEYSCKEILEAVTTCKVPKAPKAKNRKVI